MLSGGSRNRGFCSGTLRSLISLFSKSGILPFLFFSFEIKSFLLPSQTRIPRSRDPQLWVFLPCLRGRDQCSFSLHPFSLIPRLLPRLVNEEERELMLVGDLLNEEQTRNKQGMTEKGRVRLYWAQDRGETLQTRKERGKDTFLILVHEDDKPQIWGSQNWGMSQSSSQTGNLLIREISSKFSRLRSFLYICEIILEPFKFKNRTEKKTCSDFVEKMKKYSDLALLGR